jgi:hypothetical protein
MTAPLWGVPAGPESLDLPEYEVTLTLSRRELMTLQAVAHREAQQQDDPRYGIRESDRRALVKSRWSDLHQRLHQKATEK